MRLSPLLSLAGWLCVAAAWLGAADARAAGVPPAYPLWDGKETVAQYAQRVNLPETQTLDLGNGISLELVLIPAGRFIMGTPEPAPEDVNALWGKLLVGGALLATGVGALLVFIGVVILRAIRDRHRPQYSLGRYTAMILAASVGLMGGMHIWHTVSDSQRAHRIFVEWGFEETPEHEVTITKPFYVSKCVVTQEQYQQVMGANPSYYKRLDWPILVNWDDAQGFCKKASAMLPLTLPSPHGGEGRCFFRLPTEAEWEYAYRAGKTTAYYTGDSDSELARAAWYKANRWDPTRPIPQKEPNAFGLHNMDGDPVMEGLREWCQDWYGHYQEGAAADPQGAAEGTARVLRGRSWRFAARDRGLPHEQYGTQSFRVVLP